MTHGRRKGQLGPNDDMAVYPYDPATGRGTDAEPSQAPRRDDEPARRLTLGVDDPPRQTRQEVRQQQWREAGRRRRERVKAAEGLGWAFPNDVPRGLGQNPGTGRKAVVRDDER